MAVCGALLLGACATVSGYPEPTLSARSEILRLETVVSGDVLGAFNGTPEQRGGRTSRAYRDYIIDARVRLANLRFAQFEQRLHAEGVGFGIGTDWLALALNTYGSLSNNNARATAAAAAALIGARGSVEKSAFYNQALPAVMAQMAARRATVLARIRQGQALDENAYSLTRAQDDLDEYERAGSIPGALLEITTNAGVAQQAAQRNLNRVSVPGPVSADVQQRRERIADYVKTLTAEQMGALRQALGNPAGGSDRVAVLNAIVAARSPEEVDLLSQRLRILFGVTF